MLSSGSVWQFSTEGRHGYNVRFSLTTAEERTSDQERDQDTPHQGLRQLYADQTWLRNPTSIETMVKHDLLGHHRRFPDKLCRILSWRVALQHCLSRYHVFRNSRAVNTPVSRGDSLDGFQALSEITSSLYTVMVYSFRPKELHIFNCSLCDLIADVRYLM